MPCNFFANTVALPLPSRSGWATATLVGFSLMLLIGVGSIVDSGGANAFEREVIAPNELERIGLVQAWRRHLNVPTGVESIVDHNMHVHTDSPKQYVEVVSVAPKGEKKDAGGAGGDANAEAVEALSLEKTESTAPKRTLYARYLLEVPDAPEGATALTSTIPLSGAESMLDRMTFGGRASFASSGLLDRAEAERRARNDIRRLKRRGIEAEIRSRDVPLIRMYTLGDDGTLECRDAETGEIVWLRRVGNRARGYSGLGVDNRFLTVVNGGELIKLDVTTGSEFGVDRLRYVPTRGPRHCGGFVVIPSVGHRIVAYPLDDIHRDIHAEIVIGGSLATPTLAMGSEKIAWGTSGEYVYLMEESGEPSIQFRLGTDGIVGGAPAAASGSRFFFGSAAGQIYGLRATRSGEVMWTRPTGDPIFDSPIVFGEQVLFRSAYGNLICVDAATGANVWKESRGGIAQIMAVIEDQIYAASLTGTMVILNTEDGSIAHELPGVRPRVLMPNIVSDRLYLVDKMGTLQCLRRPDADMPTLPVSEEQTIEEEEADKEAEKKPLTPEPKDNPFGGGGDPFGGGGDPFGGGGDPFGPAAGGDDPFGPF